MALALSPVWGQAQGSDSVGSQIRSSAGGKVKAFYRTRGYWPLWVRNDTIGPEADRLIELVSSADLDGLNPRDYDPDRLRYVVDHARGGSLEALADAEVALSRTFARYVRDVRGAPSVTITYLDAELEPKRLTESSVLRAAALAPSFADYMENVGWMSSFYIRLRDALADYRDHWGRLPDTAISSGPILRAGVKGERVAMLRQRLGLPQGTVFDRELGSALRAFQTAHSLASDGIAGSGTITALNRGAAYYERILRLNLERARVLPSPWTRHIIVDAASARLWLYDGGKEQGSMRVIVGKPAEQTPMLAGILRYAIFNPYWNVPMDLIQRRIAPKVLGGASLDSMNYEALSDWTMGATVLAPASIDWSAVAAGRSSPRIRQRPGKDNAMGRMKFMFPNDLGIYLHDTPDKALFKEKERQFSSGCVRLEDAPRLANWLFGKSPEVPSSAPEQHVPLPAGVPVYLSYLTAGPADGGIAFFNDVYGRDDAGSGQLAKR